MEKDIEILESFIKLLEIYEDEELKQVIERLINRVKELEVCLEAEEKYSEGLNSDIKSLLNIEPNNNFIPKSKIKEKIEDLKDVIQYSANPLAIDNSKYAIDILQELLEEEK